MQHHPIKEIAERLHTLVDEHHNVMHAIENLRHHEKRKADIEAEIESLKAKLASTPNVPAAA